MKFETGNLQQMEQRLDENKQDKDAWVAEQKALKERYKQLYRDNLGYINGNSGRMRELLDIMARFPEETVKNVVLIHSQKSDAICVSPERVWKRYPGVKLPGDDKAVWLFTKGRPFVGQDGKPRDSWNITKCFDAADISGVVARSEPVERQPQDVLAAIVHAVGTKTKEEQNDQGKDVQRPPVAFMMKEGQTEPAVFNAKGTVLSLREGLSPQEKCEEAICALCHRELRLFGQEGGHPTVRDGFIAYCAAYLICKRINLPFSNFELPPQAFTAQTVEDFESQVREIKRTSLWLSSHIQPEIVKAEQERARREAPVQETTAPEQEG